MPLIKCPECDHEISPEAEKCQYCGKPINKKISPGKKVGLFILLIIAVFIFAVLSNMCSEGKKIKEIEDRKQKISSTESVIDDLSQKIPFKIIKRGNMGTRGISLVLIVPGKMTKEEVMKLAKQIQDSSSKTLLFIQIFDSIEAYKNQGNDKYPEKKYWKHFLVDMAINPSSGINRVDWVAEGRNH